MYLRGKARAKVISYVHGHLYNELSCASWLHLIVHVLGPVRMHRL